MHFPAPLKMASYAEQLASVQEAIAAIEGGGQEVEFEGHRKSRADLATLYKREGWLQRMAAREARGGGIRMRGIVLK